MKESEQISMAPAEVPVTSVDLTGRTVSRAIPLPDQQVAGVLQGLIQANEQRNTLNSRIASRLNAERPYSQSELARGMQSWRSNFTTRPLATLCARAYGRFPRAVAEAKTLTMASLPKNAPNGAAKADFFRDRVTRFIRSEPRWKGLIDDIAHENTLFGYTAAVWLDRNAWLPQAVRQDELFVPTGSGQHATTVPYFAVRVNMLPHEAYDMLLNAEAAQNLGGAKFTWYPERFAEAITDAIRDDSAATTSTSEDQRKLVDLRRQLATANTIGSGRKVVPLYHLWVSELTGALSHFILDHKKRLLFEWLDEDSSVLHRVAFFSLEKGDKTLHGSKGVGRIAYNIAAIVDRSTNDVVDRSYMAGKLFVKSPVTKHRSFAPTMRGGFCLIDPDFEVLPTIKLDAGVESSAALDAFLNGKMDEMAGTVSPRMLEGERVTAAAVNLLASRESDRSDDYLGRFLPQTADMVTECIRRACLEPEMEDPRVQELRRELLEGGLSPEEIAYLAEQPAMTTLSGWTGMDRQQVIVACVEGRGNPVYNARALEEAKLTAQVGPEFAQQVLLPDPDPIYLAEQMRAQVLENMAITHGNPIPVSLRDNHAVHIQTALPAVQAAVQEAMQNPAAEQVLEGLVAHMVEHVKAAGKDPAVQPLVPVVQQLESVVEQLKAHAAKAAEAANPGGPAPTGETPGAPGPEGPPNSSTPPPAPAVIPDVVA